MFVSGSSPPQSLENEFELKFDLMVVAKKSKDFEMGFCYPTSPKKWGVTAAIFLAGATLFAVGLHLSYVHVAPQQARIKARSDFVKDRLRKKYGYGK